MPRFGRSASKNYIAPLSSRERLILAEWERARVTRVTRAEIAVRWGQDKADKITSTLVRKQALRRVGRGIFLVVPLRAQARPSTSSAAVAAAALLQDEPYYLPGRAVGARVLAAHAAAVHRPDGRVRRSEPPASDSRQRARTIPPGAGGRYEATKHLLDIAYANAEELDRLKVSEGKDFPSTDIPVLVRLLTTMRP